MDKQQFQELVGRLKQDADSGNAQAMKLLGDAYYQGASGNEKNIAAALPHWQRAADHGETSVACKVGFAYYHGDGCDKSESDALYYFELAAEGGDVEGMFTAGLCYQHGFGCDKNEPYAKWYYEKAALLGHGEAQWRLGTLLFEENTREGFHWICCAHLSGIKKATDMLNKFISNGTKRDVIQYQIDLIKKNGIDPKNSGITSSSSNDDGGCYIATCVYGSYDCPQVWTLRRFRDHTLAATWFGRLFVRAYYAISPTLVKWFGHTLWFKNMWRKRLNHLVATLQNHGVESTPYQDKHW